MEILKGLSLESLFIIVFGVFIFVIGINTLRTGLRAKKKDMVKEGTVVKSRHVTKRDAEKCLIQNYFELRVEYMDNGHKVQDTINSLSEFHAGDRIKIKKSSIPKGNPTHYTEDTLPMISIWMIILSGIFLAWLPTAEQRFGTRGTSLLLAAVMIASGVSLIAIYVRDSKRKLIEVDATVIDVLKWYTGKKNSKLTKQTVFYYPILQYSLNNQEKTMRSKYSSSLESKFKIGSKKTIYYDCENKRIIENTAKKSMLIGAILLIGIAAIGLLSGVLP